MLGRHRLKRSQEYHARRLRGPRAATMREHVRVLQACMLITLVGLADLVPVQSEQVDLIYDRRKRIRRIVTTDSSPAMHQVAKSCQPSLVRTSVAT